MKSPIRLIRKHINKLHAYVPGEQPKMRRLLKLNTNENPYPPSPKVIKATQSGVDDRLRLYPDPTSSELRKAISKLHKVQENSVIIGNGSDDILAMCIRTFVEPVHPQVNQDRNYKNKVQIFQPSYSLYPVLAEIHGAVLNEIPLLDNFDFPLPKDLKKIPNWDPRSALTFITTPNAPSGRGYSTSQLEQLCRSLKGVIVIDEAYVDFADENAMELVRSFPNLLVCRTFSKSYSLCFQRVGYAVGHPDLIGALDKVRDSYNVNGLGQIAAMATLKDLPYYQNNFELIKTQRSQTSEFLNNLDFKVLPSQTNFLLVRPPLKPASFWFEELRNLGVIVRYFNNPNLNEYLRVTIGSESEMKRFHRAIKKVLKMIS